MSTPVAILDQMTHWISHADRLFVRRVHGVYNIFQQHGPGDHSWELSVPLRRRGYNAVPSDGTCDVELDLDGNEMIVVAGVYLSLIHI